jgi:hypothetical protein
MVTLLLGVAGGKPEMVTLLLGVAGGKPEMITLLSGAQTTVSTASGICRIVIDICRYCERVGTGR